MKRSCLSNFGTSSVCALLLALVSALVPAKKAFADESYLIGGWRLVSFESSSDNQPRNVPPDGVPHTLTLLEDGRAQLRLGCNSGFGEWKAEASSEGNSGRLRFGALAGTRALCPPDHLDELVMRQAEYLRGYLLKGNDLYLSLMADGGIFHWQRTAGPRGIPYPQVSPEEGGPRNWQITGVETALNLRAEPSIEARVLERLEPGALLDNLGCRQVSDMNWCDVQRLGGGARGYVAANFLTPAISPSGWAMFGPDDSAVRAGAGQFDATGQLPCEIDAEKLNCEFAVSRAGGGYATLVVTGPDERERVLFFRMGRAIGASVSEADNPGAFTAKRNIESTLVSLGKERYRVPDAIPNGG